MASKFLGYNVIFQKNSGGWVSVMVRNAENQDEAIQLAWGVMESREKTAATGWRLAAIYRY